jgi:hypothetical protein
MIPDFVIKPRSVNFHFDAFADLNLEFAEQAITRSDRASASAISPSAMIGRKSNVARINEALRPSRYAISLRRIDPAQR